MKLTGRAKKLFEEWYLKLPNSMGLNYGANDITINRFYSLPKSMQWGIFQDWADSMKCEMWVEKSEDGLRFWYNIFGTDGSVHYNEGYSTRQEARNAAIEKLNDLINEQ